MMDDGWSDPFTRDLLIAFTIKFTQQAKKDTKIDPHRQTNNTLFDILIIYESNKWIM